VVEEDEAVTTSVEVIAYYANAPDRPRLSGKPLQLSFARMRKKEFVSHYFLRLKDENGGHSIVSFENKGFKVGKYEMTQAGTQMYTSARMQTRAYIYTHIRI
jgi:hypothetical protein